MKDLTQSYAGVVLEYLLRGEVVIDKLEAGIGIEQLGIAFLPRPEHLDLQANQASTLVPQ